VEKLVKLLLMNFFCRLSPPYEQGPVKSLLLLLASLLHREGVRARYYRNQRLKGCGSALPDSELVEHSLIAVL
jgi:hypothetical protein